MFLRINAPFSNPQAISGSRQSGFGLVELMVSISIMMLLSVIILVRNSSFNGSVLLRNQAYEIAFALRQAQLLAVSGNNSNADSSTLVQQYGVYFNKTTGSNQTYIVYHDRDADGKWSGSPTDEQVGPAGHLDARFKIRSFTKNNTLNLVGTSDSLSVLFRRPDFDALFKKSDGSSVSGPAYIDISQVNALANDDTTGAVRRIEVTSAGQISVMPYDQP